MRLIVLVVYAFLAYWALRVLLRWLLKGPRKEAALELVLDPECGVHIPKHEAVTRRVKGSVMRFCGERCADAHRARHGD